MSRLASPQIIANITPEEKERLFRETRQPMALGVLFSFYALSAIFVSTRIWIRLQRLTLDDWLIAVSMVRSLTTSTCQGLMLTSEWR